MKLSYVNMFTIQRYLEKQSTELPCEILVKLVMNVIQSEACYYFSFIKFTRYFPPSIMIDFVILHLSY